jgi:hypothetical protein
MLNLIECDMGNIVDILLVINLRKTLLVDLIDSVSTYIHVHKLVDHCTLF